MPLLLILSISSFNHFSISIAPSLSVACVTHMPELFVRLSFSPALLAYGLRHGPVRSRLRDATCGVSAQRFQSHQLSYEGEPQQFRLRGLCDDIPSRLRGLVSQYAPNRPLLSPQYVEIKFSAATALIYIKVPRWLRAKYNVIIY